MPRTIYACSDCGTESDPQHPECSACGGEVERVHPLLVATMDIIEASLIARSTGVES
jgi:DNA-directed RNA polymerase subunit RPC12/RpoP